MSTTNSKWDSFEKRVKEPNGFCDFRRFCKRETWQFTNDKGRRRKHVRCPRCNRRLRLHTIVHHDYPCEHGVAGYRIPDHKPLTK